MKRLVDDRKSIDQKIRVLEQTIEVYRLNKPSFSDSIPTQNFDFRAEAIEIFRAVGNKPLAIKEIIAQVLKKHPTLRKEGVRSKIVYAVRPPKGYLVKTGEYGKYTYKL